MYRGTHSDCWHGPTSQIVDGNSGAPLSQHHRPVERANAQVNEDFERTDRTPKGALAEWANQREEWVRRIVGHVIAVQTPLSEAEKRKVFDLFLQENGLVTRSLPQEPALSASQHADGDEPALASTSLSNVAGVNALVSGQTIEFNTGLTLLYGENATGKTGYARVLKSLAGSRSVDNILPDINDKRSPTVASAEIEYRLGQEAHTHHWSGYQGRHPFNRMPIFDNAAATLHVDEALGYSFRPASLALFDHVTLAVQSIQQEISEEVDTLDRTNSDLAERFDKRSPLHATIGSLGPATNLEELKKLCTLPGDASNRAERLRQRIAALESNLPQHQIALQNRLRRVLTAATQYASATVALPVDAYNAGVGRLSDLQRDRKALRDNLFAAADLPAELDQTWETFIRSGQEYKQHLERIGRHDQTRCLYCQQRLSDVATRLIEKYSDYLEDRIAADIQEVAATLQGLGTGVMDISIAEVTSFVDQMRSDEQSEIQVAPNLLQLLRQLTENDVLIRASLEGKKLLDGKAVSTVAKSHKVFRAELSKIDSTLEHLKEEAPDQSKLLSKAKADLLELEARLKLKEAWPQIELRVANSRRAAKLTRLRTATSTRLRQITSLSKSLSEEMANRDFQHLFESECKALRAPQLELDFFGRQGQVHRRKLMEGAHLPSKVFSEGEQKVLALADFLAEARLYGAMGPIVFDDPVSSLDHRRIGEVATRIAELAKNHQVIVFTHDIFFATQLLSHFENSQRCSYYRISDEDGIGQVAHATGLRTDTIRFLRGKINATIQGARSKQGEARTELVRDGYGWIRSWCEIFVETELLAGVTQRYHPNVRTTALKNINTSKLGESIETVVRVFEDASRFMTSHSQPAQNLAVSPTLEQLEGDWQSLKDCRESYLEGK